MRMMVKMFMINVENLATNEDAKRIEDYFKTNLEGVENLDINLSLKLVSVRYNDSIGSPKYILDAFDRLGYKVR